MKDFFVKICGITNLDDALYCVDCGADALGFIFYEKSDRYLKPETAAKIIERLPEHITKVGVFVNAYQKKVNKIIQKVNISAVQLHGNESPADCQVYDISVIKAFHVKDEFDVNVLEQYPVDAFLLDTYKCRRYGGTGETFDWNIVLKAKEFGRIILSGGLNPKNVEDALRYVQPYGVDVNSGVEHHPGKKDWKKVKDFITTAKSLFIEEQNDIDGE